MFTPTQLKNILQKADILEEKEFKKLNKAAQSKNVPLQEYLIEKKIIPEDLLYNIAANYFKVSSVNLKSKIIPKDVLNLIPETIAQTHKIIAFEKVNKKLKIATLDPQNLQIFEFIKRKTNCEIEVYLTTPESIKNALNQYRKLLETEFEKITKEEVAKGHEKLKELIKDQPVAKIIESLLDYAITERASDIHIEPYEKKVVIRYRIDGILKNVLTLPKDTLAGVVNRIKVLANLKIDEHRLPQDGRFKLSTERYKVSFRVSIIPVFDGEKIVMRILQESSKMITLEELGLESKPLEITKRNIKKPYGMILVTGPTGCGKTTTLYSILHILNTPDVNITTIEDPIEYQIPGINQSQVNSKIGFTFANGLRTLVRQDPNIIMVGEIRDKETAAIALNAAMTGHLVLSTLHANDAVTALPRLLEMGILSFLVASTCNIIIAQRLVRKICHNCIQSITLDKKEIQELKKQVDLETILKTLEREGTISSAKEALNSMLFYRGKGCQECHGEGYKGRIGIFEVLEVTKEISQALKKNITTEDLREIAKKQKMISMIEDGFIKAKSGITTIEEILRVTKE
ncbi:MAG: hypothetical protein COY82_01240 [Parcubacteria group bacterium CG_4_10_14_0_8_um_filter_35_7]|nr:MAG: hypothetical protein COY82_01240 [Parcubacteria group bacterium CG_4_10_14_0_8_um_filter_35_7]